MEQFFPSDGILEDDAVAPHEIDEEEQPQSTRPPSRRSVSSGGYSHIIGDNNGERPGGFILVIDGGSLGHVRFLRFEACSATDLLR